MKILLAEDDSIGRAVIASQLKGLDLEVVSAEDGQRAWDILNAPDAPRLALLDWMMPGPDGVEICRRLRAQADDDVYVIMLTARDGRSDVVEALEAGADDYLVKPCDPGELGARIKVGQRILDLQRRLQVRVEELEKTLAKVRELRTLLPICSYCRQIRDDQQYWQSIEAYFARHSDIRFSHGICPSCYDEQWAELLTERE